MVAAEDPVVRIPRQMNCILVHIKKISITTRVTAAVAVISASKSAVMISNNADNVGRTDKGISSGVATGPGVAYGTSHGEASGFQVERPAGLDLANRKSRGAHKTKNEPPSFWSHYKHGC